MTTNYNFFTSGENTHLFKSEIICPIEELCVGDRAQQSYVTQSVLFQHFVERQN